MQRKAYRPPLRALTGKRELLVDRGLSFSFGSLFEPEVSSELEFTLRGKAVDGQGRVTVSLYVADKLLFTRKLFFGRDFRRYRFVIDDKALSYGSTRVALEPQKGKQFLVNRATLEAPDPKFIYRVLHKFRTTQEAEEFLIVQRGDGGQALFLTDSDADAYVSHLDSVEVSDGHTFVDLESVFNIEDPFILDRTVQKLKLAVPASWSISDDN